MPGPAAYGRGGTEATTTDANLWLGRINRDYFCGGTVQADMDGVAKAIEAVGSRLGVDADEAARGIVRIANNNMVNALKLVSVNRGFDPRDFTLIAFGGGGAMHAVALAQELGVTKVVVPADASVFSAWGMLMSDLRRDDVVTLLVDLTAGNAAAIEAAFGEAEERARSRFADEGIAASAVKLARLGKFRYQNQEHTTEVPLETGPVTAEGIAAIEAAFHETYEREYTYRLDAPVEMVGFHVVATVDIGRLTMTTRQGDGAAARRRAEGHAPRRLCAGRHARGGDLRRREAGARHGIRRACHRRRPRHHGRGPPRQPRRGGRLRQYPHSYPQLNETAAAP